ncbi:traB domain-containing protein [Agrilus planipennis]|uniref:TraB domain-containing protein n=1 Tax=Agrilus planipennis TaxID=224129 RepID=A0A1W4XMD4_AGRPL|nr:traB domain-containing protein [Agrilus planipennis]
MDTSAEFILSESTVKVGSDSEKSSEKSENFEELLGGESDVSSTESNENRSLEDFDNNLPETVTLLKHPSTGVKVYLVGTAHFSKESQEDVIKVIRNVQPHIVMLELCKARTSILSFDEETILEESKNIDMQRILSTIRSNGVYNGIMYLLLLNMNSHLTREIGMAPGGEFRAAFKEAVKLQNCGVHLGDRPIQITLQRALAKLSWFQTIKLAWHLLTTKGPISKEEIERTKKRDMLEQLLAEMSGQYPALGEVFVDERDVYLTHSLQMAATLKLQPKTHLENVMEPLRVVGVVGLGHVMGITKLWNIDQRPYVDAILTVPPPSTSWKILKITVRVSVLTLGCYLLYRFVPVPQVLKETCQDVLDKITTTTKDP